jgi:uncharacterized protein
VARDVGLVVFAKPPLPGLAKTRLAGGVGEIGAAQLARAFLRDTVDGLAGYDVVLATTDPSFDHGVDVACWDQGQGSLGARIERMLARVLEDHRLAVALGADAPGLPRDHLATVLGLPGDFALGPSEDGGFWALRAARVVSGMLDRVPWSSATTAAETSRALQAHGAAVSWGPTWWDIDTPDELVRFRRTVPRAAAPATHAALDALGWSDG